MNDLYADETLYLEVFFGRNAQEYQMDADGYLDLSLSPTHYATRNPAETLRYAAMDQRLPLRDMPRGLDEALSGIQDAEYPEYTAYYERVLRSYIYIHLQWERGEEFMSDAQELSDAIAQARANLVQMYHALAQGETPRMQDYAWPEEEAYWIATAG